MPRLRRSAVAALAGAALAAWWGMDTGPVPEPPAPRVLPPRAVPRPRAAVVAAAPAASVRRTPRPGRAVRFFRAASRGRDLARIARDLIEENRDALGLADLPGALRMKREFESLGGHHLRLEQAVDGVPVFQSEVSAHVARDGRPLLVQADVFPVEDVTTVPAVDAGAALAAALEFVADDD